jgi:hypothetical protein
MSVVEPPPSQSGDELDGLLRAFLRSQLPQPWPPPRWHEQHDTDPTVRRLPNGRELMRSRWTLAASVALLLFGSWLLPSRFTSDAKPENRPNGPMISNIPPDAPKGHKKQKQGQHKNNPRLAADEGEQPPELEESDIPMLR